MSVVIKEWDSENDTQFFHASDLGEFLKMADVAYDLNEDYITDRLGLHRDWCEGSLRGGGSMRDWYNCDGINDALSKSKKGYQEGLDMLEQLVDEVDEVGEVDLRGVASIRRRRKFSEIDGDGICVDRLRSGQDFWQTTERVSMRGSKYVRLVFNLSAAAARGNSTIYWRAVAAVIAAKLLEEAGYRVEIVALASGKGAYNYGKSVKNWVIRLDVKQYDEPISDMNMAIVSAPFFFRAFVLTLAKDREAIKEHGAKKVRVKKGTGMVENNITEVVEVAGADNDQTIVISECFSRSSAIEAVKEIAEQISNL